MLQLPIFCHLGLKCFTSSSTLRRLSFWPKSQTLKYRCSVAACKKRRSWSHVVRLYLCHLYHAVILGPQLQSTDGGRTQSPSCPETIYIVSVCLWGGGGGAFDLQQTFKCTDLDSLLRLLCLRPVEFFFHQLDSVHSWVKPPSSWMRHDAIARTACQLLFRTFSQ